MPHFKLKHHKIESRLLFVSMGESLSLSIVIGWLFYNSVWGCLFTPLAMLLVYQVNKRKKGDRERVVFKSEFRDVVLQLAGNLHAGYSLEQAFWQLKCQDFARSIKNQLAHIQHGLSCNQRIEDMLAWWAEDTGIEEVQELSDVVALSKQYGGNLNFLLRQLANNLAELELVDMEIDTLITAKKLEGRIMLVVPFGILAYMRLVNGAFIDALYSTMGGHILMTICLLGICFAGTMIEKIVRIEV